jgi:hypothetical protein
MTVRSSHLLGPASSTDNQLEDMNGGLPNNMMKIETLQAYYCSRKKHLFPVSVLTQNGQLAPHSGCSNHERGDDCGRHGPCIYIVDRHNYISRK